MQFISGLFFLKGALLQPREALPTFESPLAFSAAGGQSRGIRGVGIRGGEDSGLWESGFFLPHQSMEKRLGYHSLNFMNVNCLLADKGKED